MGKPNNLATTKMIKEARQLTEKSLYNLGAFDTYVSNGDGTGTVMVNTEMERFDGSENWGYNDSFNGRFYLNLKQECKAFVITQTKQFVKINQSLNLGTHEEDNSLYVASKVVYIRYDAANGNISEFKKWLSQNPLVFEYATVNSYSYKVIDAQSIRPANQEECVYWHEEWGKVLNLCPIKEVEYEKQSKTRIGILEPGTYTISLNLIGVGGLYGVHKTNGMVLIGNYADVTKPITFLITERTDISISYNAITGTTSIMLNKGNHPYPYAPYNGDIIHENRVPLYITTESLSPAQTIGGTWENLGSFQIGGNTVYAWKRQN